MKLSSEYVSTEFLHLNSAGIEYLNSDDECFRPRGRMDYHILYIHSGRCFVEENSAEKCVPEGSMILFRPGVVQKYRFCGKDNSVSCYIHFTGTACDDLLKDIKMDSDNIITVGKSHRIKALFEKMSREYILKKPCFEKMCSAYLLELFSLVARKLYYASSGENPVSSSAIDGVCLYIHDNYFENHPLKFYADYCGLSVSRFSHLFKEAVGVSPVVYIRNLRIEKAKEYLTETDLSVSAVSEIVGFPDQNYFGRVFKQLAGVSPKRFSKHFS